MRPSAALPEVVVAELALLLESQCPLVVIEDEEEDRLIALLGAAAERVQIPVIVWRAHVGISPPGEEHAVAGTDDPLRAVAFVEAANRETVYHLRGFGEHLHDARILSRMKEVCRKLQAHRGGVVVSGPSIDLPRELAPYATYFRLPPPSAEEYHDAIVAVLADVRKRRHVTVDLRAEESEELCRAVRGLSLGEVRHIVARGIVKDGRLDQKDIAEVREAKRGILERTGVLSFVDIKGSLVDVVGLSQFKAWIHTRTRAFREPKVAASFGLSAPRGVLLIGVQGCGKSLAAKAVAGEWQLPVVRLDPANLFSKYVGETEKALRRSLAIVEAMSPLVLWVDEMEKAFARSHDGDGGVSERLLGSLLAWLQEHRAPVFVVATANDITSMPPELLRKGRFDEIFFVDLPDDVARKDLFRLHLAARGRVLDEEGIARLSAETPGFSGAEIEQAVVAGLHAAFTSNAELSIDHLTTAVRSTTPLSTTMIERIAELRAWATGRAVRAD